MLHGTNCTSFITDFKRFLIIVIHIFFKIYLKESVFILTPRLFHMVIYTLH